jgi:hypothetical protein
MAGKKGRSGRKARTDGITMRAVALYIPMTKYEDVEDKERFRPESWFMQFKRIFGSKWQEEVRNLMRIRQRDYKRASMWECGCQFTIKSWHFQGDFQCKRCGQWKSQQARRVMGDLE